MKPLLVLAWACGLASLVWAVDPAPIDESALFGASVVKEIAPQVAAAPAPGSAFVPTLRWGGSADSSVSAAWQLPSLAESPVWDRGSAAVSTILYLDGRPSPLTRYYLEGSLNHDLQKGTSYNLRELFLDTSWDGKVNFRVGKQRIAWGVGTWFSPADILSLEAIDLTDTSKKREGPFAIKLDVPVGLHSLTLYSVLPQDPGVKGVAFAPRAEFLLGTFEVGVAGYWRPDLRLRPRAIVLGTGDLGPLNVTLEGVTLWGSDRQWVRRAADRAALEVTTDRSNLYFQATVGVGGSWTSAEQDLGLSLQTQYFYNGDGYDDPSILAESAGEVRRLVQKGDLTASDLSNPGKHYLAANLGVTKVWADAVNLGTNGWINLSDSSFRVSPSVTVKPAPLTSVRLQATWTEGAKGSQYSPSGRLLTPSLRLSVFEAANVEVSAPWQPTTGESSLRMTLGFAVAGF